MSDSNQELTHYLNRLKAGDPDAQRLFSEEVYDRLRRIAAKAMSGEGGQTLQPTALVHEFMLGVLEKDQATWESRGHFYKTAAISMRHLLVDSARRKRAVRHGGGNLVPIVDDLNSISWEDPDHILAFEEAMIELEKRFPEEAEVLSLAQFAGLEDAQIGEMLDCSRATVQRRKQLARSFLAKRLLHAPKE